MGEEENQEAISKEDNIQTMLLIMGVTLNFILEDAPTPSFKFKKKNNAEQITALINLKATQDFIS